MMDEGRLKAVMEDFAVYRAMVRELGAAGGAAISGGCYCADRFEWSRVKGVRVHYDERLRPRKLEQLDLGVTYRIEEGS